MLLFLSVQDCIDFRANICFLFQVCKYWLSSPSNCALYFSSSILHLQFCSSIKSKNFSRKNCFDERGKKLIYIIYVTHSLRVENISIRTKWKTKITLKTETPPKSFFSLFAKHYVPQKQYFCVIFSRKWECRYVTKFYFAKNERKRKNIYKKK